MDLDATQAIALSDYDDETDDEVPDDEKKPVAHLKVEAQKGFPETRIPIYEGINVIGREIGTCNVHLPLKSLSKQHACIEVTGHNHLIYDKSSRNKTRKGKMYLAPEVRYNIQHREEVVFADVKCTYLYENCPEGSDGDETDPGSESLVIPAGAGGNPGQMDHGGETMMYVLEEDDKSEPSSDILQETQAYPLGGGVLSRKKILLTDATQLYAADSEDEEDSLEIGVAKPFQNMNTIEETPASKPKGVMFGATQYIPESDDSDDEVGSGAVTTETETMLYDAPLVAPLAEAATMAYEMSSSSDDETTDVKNVSEEPTQAFAETIQDGATQAYSMLPEETLAAQEILQKNKATRTKAQKPAADEATMKYDMDVESTQTAEEVQEKRKQGDQKSVAAGDDSDTEGEEVDEDNMPTQTFGSVHDEEANIATQTFDTDKEGAKETSKPEVDLGGMATMAYEYDSDDDVSLIQNGKMLVPQSNVVVDSDQITQTFDSDAPTLAMDQDVAGDTQVFEADVATQILDEGSKHGGKDGTAEDQTQVLDDEPTLAVSEITTASANTRTSGVTDEDAPTQVMDTTSGDEGATQVYPDPAADTTLILNPSPSPVRKGNKLKKVIFKDAAPDDAPTQIFTEPDADATMIIDSPSPKAKRGRRGKAKADVLAATQLLGGSDDDGPVLAVSSTTVVGLVPESPSPKGKKGSKAKNDIATAPEDAETQVFDNDEDPVLKVSSVTVATGSDRSGEDPVDAAPDALDSTQLFPQDNCQTPTLYVSSVKYAKKGRARRSHLQAAEAALDETVIMDAADLVGTPVLKVSKKGITKPRRIEAEASPKCSDADTTVVFDPEMCSTQVDDLTEPFDVGPKSPILTPPVEGQARAVSLKEKDPVPILNLMENVTADKFKKPEVPVAAPGRKKRGRTTKAAATTAATPAATSPQKVPGPSTSAADDRATQAFGKDDDACTQAYSTDDMASTQAYSTDDMASTQAYSAEDMEATQAYTEEPPASNDGTTKEPPASEKGKTEAASGDKKEEKPKKGSQKGRGRGSGKKVTKAPEPVPQDEEATQAYEEVEPEEPAKPPPKGRGKTSRGGRGKAAAQKGATAEPEEAATPPSTEDGDTLPLSEPVEEKPKSVPARKGRGKVPVEEKKPDVSEAQPSRRGRGRPSVVKEEKTSPESSAQTAGTQRGGRKADSKATVAAATEKPKPPQPEPSKRGRGRPSSISKEKAAPEVRRGGRRSAETKPEPDSVQASEPAVSTERTSAGPATAKGKGVQRKGHGRGAKNIKEFEEDHEMIQQIKVEKMEANISSPETEKPAQKVTVKTEPKVTPEPATTKPARGKRKAEEEVSEEPAISSKQKRGRKAAPAEPDTTVPETQPGRRGRGKAAVAVPATEPTTTQRGQSSSGPSNDSQTVESQSRTTGKRTRGRPSTAQCIEKSSQSMKNTDHEEDSDDEFDPPIKKSKVDTSKVTAATRAPSGRGKANQSKSSAEEAVMETTQSKRGRKGKASSKSKVEESDQESVISEVSVTEKKGGRGGRQQAQGGRRSGDSSTGEDVARGGSQQSPDTSSQAQGKNKKAPKGKVPATPPVTPARSRKLNQSIPLTPDTPSLRRRTIDRKPKVMFTGVVDEQGQKTVKSLGGQLVESVYDCTHLVTDQIRRTVKLLCCISRGLLIVSPTWLERCQDARTFIDAHPFMVRDRGNEKKFQFTLEKSLERALERPLLEDYRIHVTKNVRPEACQMKDIVKCSGAEYVTGMPKKYTENTVIISCDKDKAMCKAAVSAGIPVVSAEFILTGVLQQQVSLDKYKII